MLDKNGNEMKTGMIVEITGAYFKNDNGLWFIEHSPGDPCWNGRDHSLKKIGKTGKISTTKYNVTFWPLSSYVSDRNKTAAANAHNREHAQIEIVTIENMQEVKAYFQREADETAAILEDYQRRWPGDTETIERYQAKKAHCQSIANSIYKKAESQGAYIDRLRVKYPFRIYRQSEPQYQAVLYGVQPLPEGQEVPIYRFPGGTCCQNPFDPGIVIVEW